MWLDSSVGLYYVRARVYDASVGRFLSNDPADGRRARPETFEAGRSFLGAPQTSRDPTGRATTAFEAGGVIPSALGALMTVAITVLRGVGIVVGGIVGEALRDWVLQQITESQAIDEFMEVRSLQIADARESLGAVEGCVRIYTSAPEGTPDPRGASARVYLGYVCMNRRSTYEGDYWTWSFILGWSSSVLPAFFPNEVILKAELTGILYES
jgi:RHS repeat-associated protein